FGNAPVRCFPYRDVVGADQVVGIPFARSRHINNNRRGNQASNRNLIGAFMSLGEMYWTVNVRASMLACRIARRGVKIPAWCRPPVIFSPLESIGGRPINSLLVEAISEIEQSRVP